MRKLTFLVATILLAFSTTALADHEHHAKKAVSKADARIYGEYLETRNMDVWSGQCFANAEFGLAGDQAIMAWRIQKGTWNNVSLDGLSVVGVVRAASTLGSFFTNAYPAKAVLVFDSKATAEQRAALQAFVQASGGHAYDDIVRAETAPISFAMDYDGEMAVAGRMQAGSLVGITTRMLTDKDHICGHEEVLFEPLIDTTHAMPGVATLDQYLGQGLGVSWTLSGKRSAFAGSFAR
ncbi:MAG: DUF1326 domain-containing protein [Blastocatellia bacterium]